jgi:hypothetical protein
MDDRFDDVEARFLEVPEPPRRPPRRRRRLALALTAATLSAGALAGGAFALSGSDDGAAAPAKPAAERSAAPAKQHGRECDERKGERRSSARDY